jgi:serine/threonine-protein kinase
VPGEGAEPDTSGDQVLTRRTEAAPEERPSVPPESRRSEAPTLTMGVEAAALLSNPADAPSQGSTAGAGAGGTGSTLTRASAEARSAVDADMAAQALMEREAARLEVFSRMTLIFATLVLIALPLTAGDVQARWLAVCGMALSIGSSFWLGRVLKDEHGYTPPRAIAFALGSLVSGYSAIYYFGVFSPAPAVVVFGLFFFGMGQSFAASMAIFCGCAFAHAALVGSILFGVVSDRGIISAAGESRFDALVIALLVEAAFAASFVTARATRRATIEGIVRHQSAVRALAQRDALLAEARQDLESALQVGGVGRFTDETLGSFRLGTIFGRGGMGEVYEAQHVAERTPAAVKVLHSRHLSDPEAVRRFLREARIAASLQVPNVVSVLEVGGLDSSVPYIAMERLRGDDLADVLRNETRLSSRQVRDLIRQVGRGLDAARAAGIVHRDIKPRNLFRAEREDGAPVWKILDFGVGKLAGDNGGTLTREMVVGTPAYMAPEQAAGGLVDHRADLHALAAIVYRALTGRPAFSGDAVPEILYKVVHAMPPRPGKVAPVSAEVDAVMVVAMAKDPAERFDSGAELARAFDEALRGRLDPALRERAERLAKSQPWAS